MSIIGIALIVLLLVTFVLELVGVARNDKQEVDTITEIYRLVRDNLPRPLRYLWVAAIIGLLVWTIPHFFDVW